MRDFESALKRYGIVILDVLTVAISFVLSYNIRISYAELLFTTRFQLLTAILCFLAVAFNYIDRSNKNFVTRSALWEVKCVFVENMYLVIGIIVATYFLHIQNISRLLYAIFFVVDSVLMFLSRTIIKKIGEGLYKDGKRASSIVILADKGRETYVLNNFVVGITFKIDGVLVVEEDGTIVGTVNGTAIHSNYKDIAESLVTFHIDDIVLSVRNLKNDEFAIMLNHLEEMGCRCHYILNVPRGQRATLDYFGEMASATYVAAEHAPWKMLVKRLADIVGSIVGLILCAIIGVFLVPLIKLTSPGPAIFAQTRIGLNGRKFKFYKFRSMYVDAEERKKELMEQNEMDGLMFKMKDDPRITPVGKFIRKTSLDEFPQFWNVFIGDMSLVGTRPPTEDEFMQYSAHYKRRLMMKPGITGLWQISGRSEIKDFEDVMKYDLDYIDNWSLTLDAVILIKTIGVIFKRKGAE